MKRLLEIEFLVCSKERQQHQLTEIKCCHILCNIVISLFIHLFCLLLFMTDPLQDMTLILDLHFPYFWASWLLNLLEEWCEPYFLGTKAPAWGPSFALLLICICLWVVCECVGVCSFLCILQIYFPNSPL